ncbi:hypothetical protein GGR56DRAFT_628180 [Xylariaceae sp. FL0804]|nr:hypothetical protein GGR56DRAFT_628180 [Xylariaceae sp. FL0804]
MNAPNENAGDALALFREALRRPRSAAGLSSLSESTASSSERPALDPEDLKFLYELVDHLHRGRAIVATYNLILLGVLAVLIVCHLVQKTRQRARWREIERIDGRPGARDARKTAADNDSCSESGSSSPSTASTLLPRSDGGGSAHFDVERQPLLSSGKRPEEEDSGPLLGRRLGGRLRSAVAAWLMYEPQTPIPLVRRSLPPNGSSLAVAALVGLNVALHLYRLPFDLRFFFLAFADRAGLVFVVNLPLLYLLAAKNPPSLLLGSSLAGWSYEALNLYHRRVGEWMCLEAAAHAAAMLVWWFWYSPPWLMGTDFWRFVTHPIVLFGLGALAAYELLYFTSLRSLRARCYELFLASHVALQAAALALLWLHFATARPYVGAALAVFALDRLVWRLAVRPTTMDADATVLEDGRTVRLSADWDIPRYSRSKRWLPGLLRRNDIRQGWHPADHVFLSIPQLGGSHALQAHPFTIASAAPPAPRSEHLPGEEEEAAEATRHAWFSLLIRAHSGFTSDLLRHATLNNGGGSTTTTTTTRLRARIDGPYGSRGPLDVLRASDTAVLVAGGSGIAVVFPLAWALTTQAPYRGRRAVHLLWIVHAKDQRSWVPEDALDELRRAGVVVTTPPPTGEAGRPDVAGYVRAAVASASPRHVGVVVSGPDALNRTARNACAGEVRAGRDVSLRVEKFGW